ncbi:MAG: hypothetical protein EXR86_02100 [Gammaproteobacteria bacterium]|nr:hypothetical protein [Gammaproteobacteria bacterium]
MSNTFSVLTNVNVHDYFHAQLAASVAHQQVAADPQTLNYLADMLTQFADPEQLFARTQEGLDIKPLALQYADVVHAEGDSQRKLALKRLGDIALFISGMFAGNLARKLVDVDYYIAMGSTAYRDLDEAWSGNFIPKLPSSPYAELGSKFPTFVDVLAEVSEKSHLGSKRDVLRDYEIWLRTGSARTLNKMHQYGLQPCRASASFARH